MHENLVSHHHGARKTGEDLAFGPEIISCRVLFVTHDVTCAFDLDTACEHNILRPRSGYSRTPAGAPRSRGFAGRTRDRDRQSTPTPQEHITNKANTTTTNHNGNRKSSFSPEGTTPQPVQREHILQQITMGGPRPRGRRGKFQAAPISNRNPDF